MARLPETSLALAQLLRILPPQRPGKLTEHQCSCWSKSKQTDGRMNKTPDLPRCGDYLPDGLAKATRTTPGAPCEN